MHPLNIYRFLFYHSSSVVNLEKTVSLGPARDGETRNMTMTMIFIINVKNSCMGNGLLGTSLVKPNYGVYLSDSCEFRCPLSLSPGRNRRGGPWRWSRFSSMGGSLDVRFRLLTKTRLDCCCVESTSCWFYMQASLTKVVSTVRVNDSLCKSQKILIRMGNSLC